MEGISIGKRHAVAHVMTPRLRRPVTDVRDLPGFLRRLLRSLLQACSDHLFGTDQPGIPNAASRKAASRGPFLIRKPSVRPQLNPVIQPDKPEASYLCRVFRGKDQGLLRCRRIYLADDLSGRFFLPVQPYRRFSIRHNVQNGRRQAAFRFLPARLIPGRFHRQAPFFFLPQDIHVLLSFRRQAALKSQHSVPKKSSGTAAAQDTVPEDPAG